SASRFSSTHRRTSDGAFDQPARKAARRSFGVSDGSNGFSSPAAWRYGTNALRSSGIVSERNAWKSNGSPMSGKPNSCTAHHNGGPAIIASSTETTPQIRRWLLANQRNGAVLTHQRVGKLRRRVAVRVIESPM